MAAVSRSTLRLLIAALALVSIACDPVVVPPTSSGTAGPSASPSGPGPSTSGGPTDVPTDIPTDPIGPVVSWSPLTPAGDGPAARSGHTWNGDPAAAQAYLFGGDGGTGVLGDLWTYDLSSDTWERIETIGPAPPARTQHTAVWVDDVGLIVVGGRGASGAPLADAWRFNLSSGTWSPLQAGGSTPPARSGACMAAAPDGRIWVTHGRAADDTLLADTWVFDPVTTTWSDATPAGDQAPARAGHACLWTDDGRLAIHGGTTAAGPTGDVWALTAPGTPEAAWALGPDQETPIRSDGAVALSSDRAVVAGGVGPDGAGLDDVIAFDAAALTVTTFGPGSGGPGRWSDAALVDDPASERMVAFGGVVGDAVSAGLWQLELP